jgi:hypothetical protein
MITRHLLQEILIYLIVAVSSLFIMGFAMHMLVGGLVSAETEYLLIMLICVADMAAIGFMARDVIRHRRGLK